MIKIKSKENISFFNLKKFDYKLSEHDIISVTNKFKKLHPEYFELIDWNNKIDYLNSHFKKPNNNSVKEESFSSNSNFKTQDLLSEEDLFIYILGKNESNFNIIIKIISLIERKDQIEKIKIFYFINQKLTEIKLQNVICEFLQIINLENKKIIEFLISGSKFNMGKKAIKYLELLEKIEVDTKYNTEIVNTLESIKYTGMGEKKKLMAVIKNFKLKNPSLDEKSSNKKDEDLQEDKKKLKIVEDIPKELNKPVVLTNEGGSCYSDKKVEKYENSELLYNVERPRNNLIFKPLNNNFDSKNYSNVIFNLLDSKNEIFINDFFIFLIKNDIVLFQNEAEKIIKILLDKKLYEEIEIVDRVFPISKIYKILKGMIISRNKESKQLILTILSTMLRRHIEINSVSKSELFDLILSTNEFMDLLQKLSYPGYNSILIENEEISHIYSIVGDQKSILTNDLNETKNLNESLLDISIEENNRSLIVNKEEDVEILKDIENNSSMSKKRSKLTSEEDLSSLSNSHSNSQNNDIPIIDIYNQISIIENDGNDEDLVSFYYRNEYSIDINILIEKKLKKVLFLLINKNATDGNKPLLFNNHLISLFDLFFDNIEVLTNLTVICDFIKILNTLFFKMFEKDVKNVLIMKLCWKHSKDVSNHLNSSKNLIDKNISYNCQQLLNTIDTLYSKYNIKLSNATETEIKVSLLHLQNLCSYYSTNVLNFKIKGNLKKLISHLLFPKKREGLQVAEIRKIFKNYI